MKAIIKETGETVEVTRIETKRLEGKLIGAHEIFSQNELELSYTDADWEERRYELAKAAMQGFIANTDLFDRFEETGDTMVCLCSDSTAYADEMIKHLKGGKK